jgi:hypothetical protein
MVPGVRVASVERMKLAEVLQVVFLLLPQEQMVHILLAKVKVVAAAMVVTAAP